MKMRSAFLTTIVAGFLLSSACGVHAQNDGLLDPVAAEGEEAPLILEPQPEPQPEPAVEIPVAPVLQEEAPAPEETPAAEAPAPEPSVAGEMLRLNVEKDMAPGIGVEPSSAKPELLSISLDNVPLSEVVRMFTRVSGANIVSGTNLQGNVTVSLKDVEWEPALRVILDSANMTLLEKRPGIYSIISKNDLAGEPLSSETMFLKYTTVTNVIPVVNRLLISSNSSVSAFASANAVIVQETASRLSLIREVIARIDKPRSQVFIEAKFVELNDKAIKNLGINWQSLAGYTIKAGDMQWAVREGRQWDQSRTDTANQFDNRRQDDVFTRTYDVDNLISGGGRTFSDSISQGRDVNRNVVDSFEKVATDLRSAVLTPDEFVMTLSALKQQNGVTVVSNPKLIVASGEKASIHVGEDYPNIKAKPQGNDTVTYVYELDYENPIKIGVTVEVTPTVNTESNISVRISPRLTRQTGEFVEPTPGLKYPVQSSTEVITDFTLESDRTVAIGGLTRTDNREVVSKIPLLGDIPFIGKLLFRHTNTEKSQTETVIFVTVSLAKAENITETGGIPEEGQLIYRHLSQRGPGTRGKKQETKPRPRVNPPAPAKKAGQDDIYAPVGM